MSEKVYLDTSVYNRPFDEQKQARIWLETLAFSNLLAAGNIKPLDALHIACAETAVADFFITCDDRLIRRYQSIPDAKMTICNPPDFVRIVTGAKP